MRSRVQAPLLALLAGVASVPPAVDAKGPEVFPLSQVKPGMKGYALTVFHGTVPERFEFEVVGVAKNMFPRMDMILVKSADPKLAVSSFAAGMSGSPMYLDGKVACAFSYSFPYAKMPIGACTPMEYMLRDSSHRARGPDTMAMAASIDDWRKFVPAGLLPPRPGDADDRVAPAANTWLGAPLPTPPPAPVDGSLRRAAIPLAISGLGPSAFEQARKAFEPYGIQPMEGVGAGGDPTQGPAAYEMGGNLSVQLLFGDATVLATGVVSYVDGNKILAFGHPFMGGGETYMPTTTSKIETIVPSMQNSFKLASALRRMGSLVSDRQSGIAADTTQTAVTIPIDIRVKNAEGEQVFHSEVVSHRFLTPQLSSLALVQALQVMSPDVADVTVTVKSTLRLKGFEPLSFTDYMYSAEGFTASALGSVRALRVLVPLMFNPFKPVKLERIQLEADVAYKADFAEIVGLRLPEVQMPPGKDTYVDVMLRPYNGRPYTQRIPLHIPERLAGMTIKLDVLPGDAARPDAAQPESLDEVIDILRTKTFPANVLVATLYTPEEGITLDGKVLPDLPDSALDTVRPAATSKRTDAYRTILRTAAPLRQVATGKQEIVLKIADKK
jgi:hypothetical protein